MLIKQDCRPFIILIGDYENGLVPAEKAEHIAVLSCFTPLVQKYSVPISSNSRYRSAIRIERLFLLLCLCVLSNLAYAQVSVTPNHLLVANDGAPRDELGISVGIAENLAIAGAWQAHSGGSGDAYVFDPLTGQQIVKLIANDGAFGDQFGYAVSISGNTALVSSHLATVGGNSGQGAAYLFNATTGQQLFKLTASDGSANDFFSWQAVALSGNTALIGAKEDQIGANSKQGSAYLFNTTNGQQTAKLVASDGATEDRFGYTVALSGNRALISADQSLNGGTGKAYLFDATTGQELLKFTSNDGAIGDSFGASVALSANYALIGAVYDDIGSNVDQGSAYLFDINTGQTLFKFTANDGAAGDFFGSAVALSGNLAFITANNADVGGNPHQGAAYVFDITTGLQVAKFTAPSSEANDRFGWSIAALGNTVVTGAIADDVGSNIDQGSAYTFTVVSTPEPAGTVFLVSITVCLTPMVHRRFRSRAVKKASLR